MSHPPDKPYERKGWVCRYSKTQGRAYLLHVASSKSTWMVDNTDPSFAQIEQEWSIEVVAKQAGKQAAKQASRDAAKQAAKDTATQAVTQDDDCFYYHSWRNNVVIAFGSLSSFLT